MHGINDRTDTEAQSMMFFTAIRDQGKTARYIKFPREPHGFREPRHQRTRDIEEIQWIQRYVRGMEWTPWERKKEEKRAKERKLRKRRKRDKSDKKGRKENQEHKEKTRKYKEEEKREESAKGTLPQTNPKKAPLAPPPFTRNTRTSYHPDYNHNRPHTSILLGGMLFPPSRLTFTKDKQNSESEICSKENQ